MRSRSAERQQSSEELEGDRTTTSSSYPPEFRRCESDYLDSQQDDDFVASVTDDSSMDGDNTLRPTAAAALPTLPRYPVLAQRNKNCWSVPVVEKFAVRGPTYLNDKKKVPSGPYLLEARGLDLFLLADAPSNNRRAAPSPKNNDKNMAQDLCQLRYVAARVNGWHKATRFFYAHANKQDARLTHNVFVR